jgi:hypothetical protein
MHTKEHNVLVRKAAEIVEMLAYVRSGRMRFNSEEEFLQMLSLDPRALAHRQSAKIDK